MSRRKSNATCEGEEQFLEGGPRDMTKLAEYIKQRYFSPMSNDYCEFKENPDVL